MDCWGGGEQKKGGQVAPQLDVPAPPAYPRLTPVSPQFNPSAPQLSSSVLQHTPSPPQQTPADPSSPSAPQLTPSTSLLNPSTPQFNPSTPQLHSSVPQLSPITPLLNPSTLQLAPGIPQYTPVSRGRRLCLQPHPRGLGVPQQPRPHGPAGRWTCPGVSGGPSRASGTPGQGSVKGGVRPGRQIRLLMANRPGVSPFTARHRRQLPGPPGPGPAAAALCPWPPAGRQHRPTPPAAASSRFPPLPRCVPGRPARPEELLPVSGGWNRDGGGFVPR